MHKHISIILLLGGGPRGFEGRGRGGRGRGWFGGRGGSTSVDYDVNAGKGRGGRGFLKAKTSGIDAALPTPLATTAIVPPPGGSSSKWVRASDMQSSLVAGR